MKGVRDRFIKILYFTMKSFIWVWLMSDSFLGSVKCLLITTLTNKGGTLQTKSMNAESE